MKLWCAALVILLSGCRENAIYTGDIKTDTLITLVFALGAVKVFFIIARYRLRMKMYRLFSKVKP